MRYDMEFGKIRDTKHCLLPIVHLLRRKTGVWVGDGTVEVLGGSTSTPMAIPGRFSEKSQLTTAPPGYIALLQELSERVDVVNYFGTTIPVIMTVMIMLELSGFSLIVLHGLFLSTLVSLLLFTHQGRKIAGISAGFYASLGVLSTAAICCISRGFIEH